MNKIILSGLILFIFCVSSKAQAPFSIVISEIMADPTPQQGLPDNEWIEIRNVTSQPINLLGWRIQKSSSQTGPLADITLDPDSALIICGSGSLGNMAAFGRAASVTYFPSLTNTGDLLVLRSATGIVVHAVEYSDEWYQNEVKKDGGWSLEMRDVRNPCTGASNWTACTNPAGGTPGRINSVDGNNPDIQPPKPLSAVFSDSLHLHVLFDEPIDSLQASDSSRYILDNGIGPPDSVIIQPPLFNSAILKFHDPVITRNVYKLTLSGVRDCSGNEMTEDGFIRAGLPETADSNDIVINEILFNPPTGGSDYVEVYNRSDKIINLKNMLIANRNSAGAPYGFVNMASRDHLLFPGDYAALAESYESVARDRQVLCPGCLIPLSSMPSFPDDGGSVLLLNDEGKIIDEVNYSDDWHYALIGNDENVALERLFFDQPSSMASNWHSASSDSHYGTPTYKNSQSLKEAAIVNPIEVVPKVFSPDNDGMDDLALIYYRFDHPGYTVNIHVYDLSGRPVRHLVKSSLAGISGYFSWDGLDNNRRPLGQGPYIIYTEIFDLSGRVRKFKNHVALARSD